MAKSLRSKSKRAFRAKKRESGKYAAAEAARLHRLNAKLAAVKDNTERLEDGGEEERMDDDTQHAPGDTVSDAGVDDGALGGMSVDRSDSSDKMLGPISTHGPRGSRREEWRKSKGLVPVPKRQGMNRQGGLRARTKAGRPSRRR